MTYFFTPQRPRQPDDDGGIFNTVMKYVGRAAKGAVIGGVTTGTPQGALAGATISAVGGGEGATAQGAASADARKVSPMAEGQLGPDSDSKNWIRMLSANPDEKMLGAFPSEKMMGYFPGSASKMMY